MAEQTIPALGHSFTGAVKNAGSGKHYYKCIRCSAYGVGTTVNATESCSGGTATCTEKAVCTACGVAYGTVNSGNHSFGAPSYVWSDDGKTCTATRVCARDGSHKETETATVVNGKIASAVKTPATCTVMGTTTYTATFTGTAFMKQTKDVQDIPVIAHSESETWTTDGAQHWKVCAVCGAITTAKANHSGGTATCASGKLCETCGAAYGETDPANHADLQAVPEQAAACTEDGHTAHWYCSGCNKYYADAQAAEEISAADVVLAATGHAYGGWTNLNETQHRRVCANDESHVETENHSWNDGVVTTAVDCETDGVKTYTCTVCGAKKTEAIPAIGHNYGDWTSLTPELHQRFCGNNPLHVERAPHNWDAGTVVNAATCAAFGKMVYHCVDCPATKEESIAKTSDHPWGAYVVTQPATCHDAGVKTRTCGLCGKTEDATVPIDPDAHVYNWTWSLTETACLNPNHYKSDGKTWVKKCGKCVGTCAFHSSAKQTLDHELTLIPKREATCTQSGGTQSYYICSRCDGKFGSSYASSTVSSNIVESPKGHVWSTTMGYSDATLYKPATCTERPYYFKICSRSGCGAVATSPDDTFQPQETSSLGGHDYSVPLSVSKYATCCEKGSGLYQCSRCSATKQQEIPYDMTNHPANKIVSTFWDLHDPTCTAAGYYFQSSVCIASTHPEGDPDALIELGKQYIIPKLDHDMTFVPAKAATCYAAGNVAYYHCAGCNLNYADAAGDTLLDTVATAKLAHDFSGQPDVRYYAVQTACEVDGKYYNVKYCKNGCGTILYNGNQYSASDFAAFASTYAGSIPEAAYGHDDRYVAESPATCTTSRLSEGMVCERCGRIASGRNPLSPPLGHDFSVPGAASVYGTYYTESECKTFFCRRCGAFTDEKYETYNYIVNLMKSTVYRYQTVTYFNRTVIDTVPLSYKTSGLISALPSIKSEFEKIRNTETTLSAGVGTAQNTIYPKGNSWVNWMANGEADFTSIDVRLQNGFSASQLLVPEFGSTITTNGIQWNVNNYRSISVPSDTQVLVITAKVKPETFTPTNSLAEIQETPFEAFTGIRYRSQARMQYGDGYSIVEEDPEMTSTLALQSITANVDATFYFYADTLKPIAAVYNTDRDERQKASMSMSLGIMGSGSMVIDTKVDTGMKDVFLF